MFLFLCICLFMCVLMLCVCVYLCVYVCVCGWGAQCDVKDKNTTHHRVSTLFYSGMPVLGLFLYQDYCRRILCVCLYVCVYIERGQYDVEDKNSIHHRVSTLFYSVMPVFCTETTAED